MGVNTRTHKHGEQTDESLSKFTRSERTISIVLANFVFSIPCMQELPPPLSKSKGLLLSILKPPCQGLLGSRIGTQLPSPQSRHGHRINPRPVECPCRSLLQLLFRALTSSSAGHVTRIHARPFEPRSQAFPGSGF